MKIRYVCQLYFHSLIHMLLTDTLKIKLSNHVYSILLFNFETAFNYIAEKAILFNHTNTFPLTIFKNGRAELLFYKLRVLNL